MSLKRAILDHDIREVWRILHTIQDFSTRDELFLLPFLSYDANMVALLLSFSYDVNLILDGTTVLHMAAWAGNIKLIRQLIDHGASIHLLDEHGNTPLHRGCLTSLQVVQLLVEEGVNVSLANNDGYTAIQIVQKSKHTNVEIVKYLTDKAFPEWHSWWCLPCLF